MKKKIMKINFLIKVIRHFINEFRRKDVLNNFNKSTNNNINSFDVHLNSINGHHIEISKGTHVSADSHIDSYTFIGVNSLISKTIIGRYNSIASNVSIGQGEHPLDKVSTNIGFIKFPYETLTIKQCLIENDVWVGVGVTIRRGVRVGTGSVIGANSFVNKDVPPYAIVVGSPARIIKYRFTQKKINILLKSKWWEYDLEKAQVMVNALEKISVE